MTQQNAAMVEETTAASRELASQADGLLALVQQFKIEGNGQEMSFSRATAGKAEEQSHDMASGSNQSAA